MSRFVFNMFKSWYYVQDANKKCENTNIFGTGG